MKTLSIAAVLASTLFGTAAFARPHGAGPAYAAPGYHTAAPVYVADEDRYDHDRGWRHRAWENFNDEQSQRDANENAFLANERFNFARQWGWNPMQMAQFDQHQAQERASFNADQARRRQMFEQQLAMREHGRRHWDWD
jgi:hypothetical protein